jgi:hypothetical protein
VSRLLQTQGWSQIMRAAASKGSADLLMSHPVHGGALLQVGRASKRLGPADRDRLVTDAESIGALALLAVFIPREGVTLWQVTRGKPAEWARWVS